MTNIEKAALFIFLNKTCFNGLYRVNLRNEFTTSFGKKPKLLICDKESLRSVSGLLQDTNIMKGDYSKTLQFASEAAFYYLDPPYIPVKPNSFISYTKQGFDNHLNKQLVDFCFQLTDNGASWLLSNSDASDSILQKLYQSPGVFVNRVKTRYSINPLAKSNITEVLISNYDLNG